MEREFTLQNDMKLKVVVGYTTKKRLETTCFRKTNGSLLCASGNCCRWTSMEDVLNDADFVGHLLPLLADLIPSNPTGGTFSSTCQCRDVVGWTSTVPMEMAHGQELFRHSLGTSILMPHALFFKDKTAQAPQTHLFTVVYELKKSGPKWLCIIHSAYPGRDVGELVGDVTARENRVFYDFQNPGSDSFICNA